MKSPRPGGRTPSQAPPRPARQSTGPRKARAGRTRDRILAAATELFAQQGFAAISVRDIARQCGVNLPTIYHYFGGKDGLYDACYKATFEAAADALRTAITEAPSAELRIRNFTVKLCEIFMRDHSFRRLLQREFLREEHRPIAALTTHHFDHEFRLLTAAIVELYGPEQSMERCFSIYGLALGLILMRRIGELAGMNPSIGANAQLMADYVLGIVLPARSGGGGLARRARRRP